MPCYSCWHEGGKPQMIGSTYGCFYKTIGRSYKELHKHYTTNTSGANEHGQEGRDASQNLLIFWRVSVQCHTGAMHCHNLLCPFAMNWWCAADLYTLQRRMNHHPHPHPNTPPSPSTSSFPFYQILLLLFCLSSHHCMLSCSNQNWSSLGLCCYPLLSYLSYRLITNSIAPILSVHTRCCPSSLACLNRHFMVPNILGAATWSGGGGQCDKRRAVKEIAKQQLQWGKCRIN